MASSTLPSSNTSVIASMHFSALSILVGQKINNRISTASNATMIYQYFLHKAIIASFF
jgi:hypothetical protein